MKRILLAIIAATALLAGILIPMDAARAGLREDGGLSSAVSNDISDGGPLGDRDDGQEDDGRWGQEGPAASVGQADDPAASGEDVSPGEDAEAPVGGSSQPEGQGQPAEGMSSAPTVSAPSQTSAPAASGGTASTAASSAPAGGASRPAVSQPSGGASQSPPTASLPSPPQDDGEVGYAEQVVRLVNVERSRAGLDPLAIYQPAMDAAQVRAEELQDSFSHTRPDGRGFSTALTEQGARYRTAGENIAWGQKTPAQVVEAWMNSEGHRANIRSGAFTSIGVGYYVGDGGRAYWVQLFVG